MASSQNCFLKAKSIFLAKHKSQMHWNPQAMLQCPIFQFYQRAFLASLKHSNEEVMKKISVAHEDTDCLHAKTLTATHISLRAGRTSQQTVTAVTVSSRLALLFSIQSLFFSSLLLQPNFLFHFYSYIFNVLVTFTCIFVDLTRTPRTSQLFFYWFNVLETGRARQTLMQTCANFEASNRRMIRIFSCRSVLNGI